MIMFCCWFTALGVFNAPAYAKGDDYFTQAIALQDEAWKLEDPRVLREYTVILTEFHAQQFLFRAFAMRDLKGDNKLWLKRLKTDENVVNETQGMVENNLEELLVRARKKFGQDLNCRFAIAQFLYRGRDILPSPQLKMTTQEMLATFEEAYSKGIMSGASLYILALKDLRKDDQAKKVLMLLAKGNERNPYDPQILAVLSNQAIAAKKWDIGAKTARILFEVAPSPEFKTDALVNVARVFHFKKNYKEAMTAVNTCLDIQPRHAFAWNIGLDSLRAEKDEAAYNALINRFVDSNLNDPSLFRGYLDYLKLRGVHPYDESYLKKYKSKEMPSDLAKMTHQTNIGNLHFQNGDFLKAKSFYEKARVLFEKMPGAPPKVGTMIDQLIKLAHDESQK